MTAGDAPPPRRVLADDVLDAVRALLMDAEIAPGQRANIEAIARRLRVSPTPVREALAALEREGLVVKAAHRGYTAVPLLDAAGLRDLYDVRLLLEPEAARLAAAHPPELPPATATAAGDDYAGYREFAAADARFHAVIAEASGNPVLAESIARLRAHTHLYRVSFSQELVDATTAEHAAVTAALRAGDGPAAEHAMRQHLERARDRMTARL